MSDILWTCKFCGEKFKSAFEWHVCRPWRKNQMRCDVVKP